MATKTEWRACRRCLRTEIASSTDFQRLIWRKSDGHLFEHGWILKMVKLIEDGAFYSDGIFHRKYRSKCRGDITLCDAGISQLRNMLFNVSSRFFIRCAIRRESATQLIFRPARWRRHGLCSRPGPRPRIISGDRPLFRHRGAGGSRGCEFHGSGRRWRSRSSAATEKNRSSS
jgi:hypothetical protein